MPNSEKKFTVSVCSLNSPGCRSACRQLAFLARSAHSAYAAYSAYSAYSRACYWIPHSLSVGLYLDAFVRLCRLFYNMFICLRMRVLALNGVCHFNSVPVIRNSGLFICQSRAAASSQESQFTCQVRPQADHRLATSTAPQV